MCVNVCTNQCVKLTRMGSRTCDQSIIFIDKERTLWMPQVHFVIQANIFGSKEKREEKPKIGVVIL